MKRFLLALTATLAACAAPSFAQVYIDEEFNYPNGALGSPWVPAGLTGNSTATVGTAVTLNGYTPTGKQVTFIRPTTSDGAARGTLNSGENPGTTAWTVTPGDTLSLSYEFNFSQMSTGSTATMLLRGNTITMAGLQFRGISSTTAEVQYLTTNSTTSFTNLPSTPTLSIDTWYSITMDVSIIDGTHSTYNVSIDQMGTGGGNIYSITGLELTSGSTFGSLGGISAGISGGTPIPSYANIQLAAVPEPSQAALAGMALFGLMALRVTRRRSCA